MRSTVKLPCLFATAALACSPAAAQEIVVDQLGPELGNVLSATSGDTVFRVHSSDGSVEVVSGTGRSLGIVNTRAEVEVSCGNSTACDTTPIDITIASMGSPSRRARALTNFNVTPGTAVFQTTPTGSNPLIFRIAPVGKRKRKTFYVGADFGIQGNESGEQTGLATAPFQVSGQMGPTFLNDEGLATAVVFRPIGLELTSNLAFGNISIPSSGSGSVTIDPATGIRTTEGTGVQALNLPAPSRAAFTLRGEGGSTVSIAVPETIEMSGPGGTVEVKVDTVGDGDVNLSSSPGSEAVHYIYLGGTIEVNSGLVAGNYSGNFTITASYN